MWKGKSKIIAAMLAGVLLIGGAVGGTVAWLSVKTAPVVNTFTYGDINITLDETKLDENGNPVLDENQNPVRRPEGNDYKMIPGNEIKKDPKVTVEAGNEACWLFVKVEKSGGTTEHSFDDYLEYEIAADWIQLKDAQGNPVEGVYYREVGKDTDNIEVAYDVLKDNKVKVKEDVTKEMLNALDSGTEDAYPELTITAYAVQRDNIDNEADAWAVFTSNTEGEGTDTETPTEP